MSVSINYQLMIFGRNIVIALLLGPSFVVVAAGKRAPPFFPVATTAFLAFERGKGVFVLEGFHIGLIITHNNIYSNLPFNAVFVSPLSVYPC